MGIPKNSACYAPQNTILLVIETPRKSPRFHDKRRAITGVKLPSRAAGVRVKSGVRGLGLLFEDLDLILSFHSDQAKPQENPSFCKQENLKV